MKYKVELKPRAIRDLRRLPKQQGLGLLMPLHGLRAIWLVM